MVHNEQFMPLQQSGIGEKGVSLPLSHLPAERLVSRGLCSTTGGTESSKRKHVCQLTHASKWHQSVSVQLGLHPGYAPAVTGIVSCQYYRKVNF